MLYGIGMVKVQRYQAIPVPVLILRMCTRLREIRRSDELLQPYTIYIYNINYRYYYIYILD